MNQFFNSRRFLLITAQHWNENRKRYLLSLAAIAGLLVVWFLFAFLMDNYRPMEGEMQVVTYYVGLFLTGCLYASQLFAPLSIKQKGINYLLTPASHFEKFLSALLFGVLIYFVCYTMVFYLVDWLIVHFTNSISRPQSMVYYLPEMEQLQRGRVVNVFYREYNTEYGLRTQEYYYAGIAYFTVQSVFIAGSVWFRRLSFIKTLMAVLVFAAFLVFWVTKVLLPGLPAGSFSPWFSEYSFFSTNMVRLPAWIPIVLKILILYSVPPLFWTLTYFRLKEKEI